MRKTIANPLDAIIIGTDRDDSFKDVRLVPMERIQIDPEQSRQQFDVAALAELAASVRQHGILQPIGVRPAGENYLIIFGERRYRAAAEAGLDEIPSRVYADITPAQAAVLAALENLQREELELEDEARYLTRLLNLTGL